MIRYIVALLLAVALGVVGGMTLMAQQPRPVLPDDVLQVSPGQCFKISVRSTPTAWCKFGCDARVKVSKVACL